MEWWLNIGEQVVSSLFVHGAKKSSAFSALRLRLLACLQPLDLGLAPAGNL